MLRKDTEPREVNALVILQGCLSGRTDRRTDGQTLEQRGDIAADKQMAGKWVDGQKGEESSSQTDRKTDGKLTRRQTGGPNDK